ncbi:MAG: inorganic phosphate transporter [Caldiserica bacterium]|nr:MAG: inorganic phosphate transporter [Caldisericota bacterium]
MIFKFLPGVYLGWGLGANDSANVFGPQAYSGIISYRGAAIFTAIFVLFGALVEGEKCFAQIGEMATFESSSVAFLSALSAGIMIHLMSYLKLPVSTSHAIVGSLVGVAIFHKNPIDTSRLIKSVICWIITPVGAVIFSFILFFILRAIFSNIKNVIVYNAIIKFLSIGIGCYGAYSLGANNLANVVGVYVGAGMLSPFTAKLLGGIAISIGVLTYSRNVMETVGKGIAVLDPFSALTAILSGAIILHIFAEIGVPVSSSQAIVGAVFGVGLIRGAKTISYRKLIQIFSGWIFTLFGTVLFGYVFSYIISVIK